MTRLVLMALGSICLLFGIVGVLTPIPFGIVFLVLAMLLLIPSTHGAARLIQRMRARSVRFDGMMVAAIRRAPLPYRRILRRTDIDGLYRSLH